MRGYLKAQAALIALLVHSAAVAGIDGMVVATRPDAATGAAPSLLMEALVVSLSINGRMVADGGIVYRESGDVWLLPDALLAQSGVIAGGLPEKVGGVAYRRLYASSDVSFAYDAAGAELSLRIAPQLFEGQVLSAAMSPAGRGESGETLAALIFDYDVGVRAALGEVTVDGAATAGFSSQHGLMLSRWGFSSAEDDPLIHLGTSYVIDDPDRHNTFILGDNVDISTPGMAPLPFGGLSWFSNFDLDPDFVPMPLPSVQGVAQAPGRVSVLVNGLPAYGGEVSEGEFLISDIPVSAGAGRVELVTTDIFGVETRSSQPVYVAPDLLKPGLASYSFALGWDRFDAGEKGFSYGGFVGRAGVRRGLSSVLTLNAAAEANQDVADVALGADIRIGGLAAASLGVAGSRRSDADRAGFSVSGSASHSGEKFTLGLGAGYASREFSQIGFPSAGRIKSHYGGQASLELAGGVLSAGASFMDPWDSRRSRLITFNYSHGFLERGQFVIAGSLYNGEAESAEIRAVFTMPLGGGHTASAQLVNDSQGGFATSFSANRSPPIGEGFGYALRIEKDEKVSASAQVTIRKRAFEGSIEFAQRRGDSAGRLHIRGGAVLADGALFLMRSPAEGAILVETESLGKVPIRLNNQAYGKTGRRGRALLPAQPFIAHSLSVDETAAPMDMRLERVSASVVTGRGHVKRIRFSPLESYALTAIIQLADGSSPPRGAPLLAAGEPEPLPVGYDGLVFLTSDAPKRRFWLASGEIICSFEVDFDAIKQEDREAGVWPVISCDSDGSPPPLRESV